MSEKFDQSHISEHLPDKEFNKEKSKEYIERLVLLFKSHFNSLGYTEEPPLLVTSGIDPTVRFIGSHISVLKPYLLEDRIPEEGLYIKQDCLRTRNTNKLFDDEYNPNWGSYFPSIGALNNPDQLEQSCSNAFSFLQKALGVSNKDLLIRIHSSDNDLLDACEKTVATISKEVDTKPLSFYRHKIGVKGVRGRNFNIAIRNAKSGEFADIGNIIMLENDKQGLGVETALGSTMILKQMFGLEHVQDCLPVLGLEKIENEAIKRKFEDSIITSSLLFGEGLRPFGQHNRNRILKEYVRSLSYFRAKSGINIDDLEQMITSFQERAPFDTDPSVPHLLIDIIKALERDLESRQKLTTNELKTKQALSKPE